MGYENKKIVHMVSPPVTNMVVHLGKAITVLIMGSIAMHLLVMFIDYFLMIKPLYLNLRENFVGSIFSTPMFPMMGAYGLFSLAIYYLGVRTKKAIILARKKEIQSEKAEIVLKSMQCITGILAEHIATHNSEIMNWVEFRKRQGNLVSEKVENSSKKIAKALQSLSEISFVLPYTKNRPENVADFEKILQYKLDEINGFQEEIEIPAEPSKMINS